MLKVKPMGGREKASIFHKEYENPACPQAKIGEDNGHSGKKTEQRVKV